MDSEATRKVRIAALYEEIEFIHYANRLYWRQAMPDDAARADYYRRQDRLEELRSELAELQKTELSRHEAHQNESERGGHEPEDDMD